MMREIELFSSKKRPGWLFVVFSCLLIGAYMVVKQSSAQEASILGTTSPLTYILRHSLDHITRRNGYDRVTDPTRNRLYVTLNYDQISVINTQNGTVEAVINMDRPDRMTLSPDGSKLIVSKELGSGGVGTITIIDTDNFTVSESYSYMGSASNGGQVKSLVMGDSIYLYIASDLPSVNSIKVMDITSGEIVASVPVPEFTEYFLAILDSSLYIATGNFSPDGSKLYRYDISNVEPVFQAEKSLGNDVSRIITEPDGDTIAFLGAQDGKIHQLDANTLAELRVHETPEGFTDVVYSASGEQLIGLSRINNDVGPGRIEAYDSNNGEFVRFLTDDSNVHSAVALGAMLNEDVVIIYEQAIRVFRPADYSISLPITRHYFCSEPYRDDFSEPASGWLVRDNGATKYQYLDGEYNILHRRANSWTAVTRGDYWVYNSFHLEIKGRFIARSGTLGLIFGLNDDFSEFYTFEIVPENQVWLVFHFTDANGWELIDGGHDPIILKNNSQNVVAVRRSDNNMSMRVNEKAVYLLTGQRTGRIGITGASFLENVDIRYDDYFYVYAGCPYYPLKEETSPINTIIQVDRPPIETFLTGVTGGGEVLGDRR